MLRFFETKNASKILDYGDTVGGGLKEGGLLKSDFNDYVVDSSGEKIKWVTNSAGFEGKTRRDYPYYGFG